MSETNPIEAKVAKTFCFVIDNVNKVLPIQSLQTINCFYRWLESYHKLHTNGDTYVKADYYNGSENDFYNLFNEILNLATKDHCYNGNYVLKRLEFLANEGLEMLKIHDAKLKSFKFTENEVKNLILKSSKKIKKNPKKKSIKRLPTKKLKRNKKGQFIKSK